ncbi:MAG: DNA polymerase III subunit epsilon [Pseudomonadota bacterium]
MRYIVLDTETTGLDPKQGHRLIEIGAVEVIERTLTGKTFHCYLNPERAIDEDAKKIHGIEESFLADKPKFAEIYQDLIEFCRDTELLIHNASFDMGFINHELKRIEQPPLDAVCTVRDTLKEARQLFPGKRNSLDALCERLGVNSSHRHFHGALLDAQLLAEVFLAMTRGQQSLIAEGAQQENAKEKIEENSMLKNINYTDLRLQVLQASDEEIALHKEYIDGLKQAVWKV